MSEKIRSVSEITRDIRFTLEGQFQRVWVEGEVSNYRLPSSGHHYFTLKDAGGQLSCVMFRSAAQRNNVVLQDGLKLQVFGDISVYEARGQYQLVVQKAQTTGDGELQARFEALKRKLQAEGLFAPERKIPIPFFPRTVAVVTSPTGAALQDILKVMSRRAPWIRLIVVPVKVQGEGAELEIAGAIRWLSSQPAGLPPIDTLIVARGGGSIEDLWSFNEEVVARAISDCPLPVVSGIGHEIDFTISDFVADRREPTPSAAAEASVPDGASLHQRLRTLGSSLDGSVQSRLRHCRREIESLHREMRAREPARKIQNWAQAMDYLEERLQSAINRRLEGYTLTLDRIEAVLSGWNPKRDLQLAGDNAKRLYDSLTETTKRRIQGKTDQLEHFRHLLQALGPEKTLDRGFTMTVDEKGNLIFDVADLEVGQKITTRFARGKAESRIEKL